MAALRARGATDPPQPETRPAKNQTKTTVPQGQLHELVARRSFFQTDFGTLALLPKATSKETAKRTGTFLLLPRNASCTVSAPPRPVWLQFNHHLADSNGEPRHLGALIIVHGKSAGSKKIGVYRNPGWKRQDKTEILGEFSATPDLSWEEFATLSRKAGASKADLREVDDALGGPWHAAPRGSDKYSWSYRKFWAWAVSTYEDTRTTVVGDPAQIDCFRVSARLIAYTPTPALASERPVVLSVNASRGDSVFVAVYSLFNDGVDTQLWYWVHLK